MRSVCLNHWLAVAGVLVAVAVNSDAVAQTTFTRDVAPILLSRCAPCHRPGQSAPFSLLGYEDARPRARRIAQVVSRRIMPPWKPQGVHGEFVNDRRLPDREVTTVQRWVEAGALFGNPEEMPPLPQWSDGWQIGTPDLVVAMPEAYTLRAQDRDVFRTFVIPIPVDGRRYIRAVEFLPGTPGVVHHANLKIDRSRLSRRRDLDEPGPGYEGGGSREARFPDGVFLGWTPGQSPRVSPDGLTWHLEPGSDLVVELHLMPGKRDESVQVSVGLFFTDRRPQHTAYMVRLGRQDLDIAAGDRDYVSADTYTLPVDVELRAVQPHAHFLARSIRAWATLPDGKIRALLSIDDWDFHWQDVYTYTQPVQLPRGAIISMRYTYDNSSANRRNPNRPPRRVTFGQTSASEMGSLWLQVVPRRPEDLATLERDFTPRILRDDIAGNEKWLEVEPNNAPLRAELAACYLEANRLDEALTQLIEAARLDPRPGRHYDVGRVLLLMTKYDAAEVALRQALVMNPDFAEAIYALGIVKHGQNQLDEAIGLYAWALKRDASNPAAHYNLARAFMAQGQIERAIESYHRAIELAPEDADAHQGLGRALAMQNRLSEAIYRYRRTLEIDPDRVGALLDLAWIIATAPDVELRVPAEAVRAAERAVRLTNGINATALDTLAAAYAAAGRMDVATSTAEKALAAAVAAGEQDLGAQIRARLQNYRTR